MIYRSNLAHRKGSDRRRKGLRRDHGLSRNINCLCRISAGGLRRRWFTVGFANGRLAYELAYGEGLTPCLRVAQPAGAGRIADGVGVLVEQAAEAFEWRRGARPAAAPLIARLTKPLN